MTDWAAALDQFEDRLDSCRSLLDSDTDPDMRPWPPVDLVSEQLPEHLMARAEQLVTRATELERELIERRASLPEPRPTVRRRRNPGLPRMSTEL